MNRRSSRPECRISPPAVLSGRAVPSASFSAALAAAAAVTLSTACSGGSTADLPPVPIDSLPTPQARQRSPQPAPVARDPVIPPRIAMLAGLLPTKSIGVDTFRMLHPQYDGRGVLIGILDSGIDPGVPGLRTTTTGRPKVIELRDFSGEGRIALEATYQVGDTLHIGERLLTGLGRVARLASPPYYVGEFRERALGVVPMADVNGDGDNADVFGLVVAKASSGWFVMTDTDGDGSLEDEEPVRDFAVARGTFLFHAAKENHRGPMTFAVNLREENSAPVLDFFFDNSSHGTHVAGIAAGHGMFGVEGFDGVAPGAQLLGLKISHNARGSISVTGSMLRAMNHALDFARRRNLPLVLNLSFGIGNEKEGAAAIDSLVNEFTLENPDVLFVIASGNDGPGLSTIRFPGSAEYAMSVCALFPGVFVEPPSPRRDPPGDVVAWWSARGGEVAKPDVCAPGVAYSNVPLWRTGEEISPGTSQAAPQIAGAAALLQSALLDRGRRARAIDLMRALMNTATRPDGASILDVGAGIPNVEAAFRWLHAAHQTGVYEVRSLPDGGNSSAGPAAYRRSGLSSRADTLQRFIVRSIGGQPSARFQLYADAEWLDAPPVAEPQGRPFTIPVRYDPSQLSRPGVYVGTVWGRSATDSMAGPAFELVNTVVVPYSLQQPMAVRGVVEAGAVKRYFLEVSEHAGGLTVSLAVPSARDVATLHLFEPGGQPQRETNKVSLGGAHERSGTIRVRGDDLVPGVYEAVVVAQPTGRASFELEAAVPTVALQSVRDGPSVTVQNPTDRTVSTSVSAMLIGAIRAQRLTGTGADPQVITVEPPPEARELVLEVALDPNYWQTVTDFGVTLFDSADTKLGDHPLIYSFGRQRIHLDSLGYAGTLTIELLPAYAHLDPPDTWTADVTVAFLLENSIPLISSDSTDRIRLPIRAGVTETVEFLPVPDTVVIPQGYWPLVEATARTPFGPAVVRRGAAIPR